ncbi:molybdenum cofactor biosynthesis protein MoaE [Rhodococcus opacus]|uniref:molybdenum cofactor biosynthesis protein MoaE n=1 Tax=Rhodococcus opacus TaxID=37919 RepID=UPI00217F0792|nr:molybdenum cofactor biosynthesis protein MoaE [Rhodococcus opacus]
MRANVQPEPIDIAELDTLVDLPRAGAQVSFVGRVRTHDAGRGVEKLEYSSHPTANAEALRIANEVLRRSEGVCAIAITHRVGCLDIGEAAVVCAISAEHRGQAFEACRELVERVKHELPIWKHQTFTDGTDEWVGSA